MENKNTTRENYIKIEIADTFALAQKIVNSFKRKGYDFPPVLALEKELKSIQAQQFLKRRRRTQKIFRYEKKEVNR